MNQSILIYNSILKFNTSFLLSLNNYYRFYRGGRDGDKICEDTRFSVFLFFCYFVFLYSKSNIIQA